MSVHNSPSELTKNIDNGVACATINSGKTFILENASGSTVLSVADTGAFAVGNLAITAAGALSGVTTISATSSTAAVDTTTGAFSSLVSGPKIQSTATAVTATDGGGTTGLIPARSSHITVTSANANHSISLPAGTIGDIIYGFIGANGCEMIAVTASDKVNGVTVGATNELALPANTTFECRYVAANTWIVLGWNSSGVALTLTPDALA